MEYLLAGAQSNERVLSPDTQPGLDQTQALWNILLSRAGVIGKATSKPFLQGTHEHNGVRALSTFTMDEIMINFGMPSLSNLGSNQPRFPEGIDYVCFLDQIVAPGSYDQPFGLTHANLIFNSFSYPEIADYIKYNGNNAAMRESKKQTATRRAIHAVVELSKALGHFERDSSRLQVAEKLGESFRQLKLEQTFVSLITDTHELKKVLRGDDAQREYNSAMEILINYDIFEQTNPLEELGTHALITSEQPDDKNTLSFMKSRAQQLKVDTSKDTHRTVIVASEKFSEVQKLEVESQAYRTAKEVGLDYRLIRTPGAFIVFFYKNTRELKLLGGEAYVKSQVKLYVDQAESMLGKTETKARFAQNRDLSDLVELKLNLPPRSEATKTTWRQRISSGLNAIDERGFKIGVKAKNLIDLGIKNITVKLDNDDKVNNYVLNFNLFGKPVQAVIDREGKFFLEPGFSLGAYQTLEYHILNYIAEVKDSQIGVIPDRTPKTGGRPKTSGERRFQDIPRLRVLPHGHRPHNLDDAETAKKISRYYGNTSLVEMNAHFMRAQSDPTYLSTIKSESMRGRIQRMLEAIGKKDVATVESNTINVTQPRYTLETILDIDEDNISPGSQQLAIKRTLEASLAECKRLDPNFDRDSFLSQLNFLPFFTTFVNAIPGEERGEPRGTYCPEADLRSTMVK